MKSPSLKSFLTNYVENLLERTRIEGKGVKYGFDWLIYNLGLSRGWTPIRLPFVRQGRDKLPKAKTEAEFGIDVSFLTSGTELLIFVLKDENLNNTSWVNNSFDTDLRKAITPDVSDPRFSNLRSVKVILAYNKGDDHTGIQLYNNFVSGSPGHVGDTIVLSHERWNLDKIVQEVTDSLLTPELLPQNVSGMLGFLCGIVARTEVNSPDWENQVVPTWKQFLTVALQGPVAPQSIHLVTVSLIILQEYVSAGNPTSRIAWIELIEWAMLSLWKAFPQVNGATKELIVNIWMDLYVFELDQYIGFVSDALTTQDAVAGRTPAVGALSAVGDGYSAFWTLGRLGLLTVAPQEIMDMDKNQGKEAVSQIVRRNAEILIKALHHNPAFLRPLLDAHHVQLFLTWLVLRQSGSQKEMEMWLTELEGRLLMRRVDNAGLPFPEGRNRLDLVAEYAATQIRPPEYVDDSSYLLMMILELCFSLPDNPRDMLLKMYHEQIVLGIDSKGDRYARKSDKQDVSPINLVWWCPSESWGTKVLDGPCSEGVSVAVSFESNRDEGKTLAEWITGFVELSRKSFPGDIRTDIPRSVLILACMKYNSPLPSEFWRELVFPNATC